MSKTDLDSLLERHSVFWSDEGTEPLIRTEPFTPLQEKSNIPLADGTLASEGRQITPELIDPKLFYNEDLGNASPIKGDFLTGLSPPGLCWTEAIVGCPVSIVTGGPWADPFVSDPAQFLDMEPNAVWLAKLDQFVDYLSDRTGGGYPIVQPLLRGPIDMMASAVGHEEMCHLLMADSDDSDIALSHCADTFIESANRRLAHTPEFHGGYLSSFGIWAPGRVVLTQLDNATMLSPQTYAKRVMEHDRRVIEAFDFALIHVHSGCLHIIDHLLEIDALKIIQVSIDHPGGPLAHEVLPILQRIISHKPLILTGPVTHQEYQDLKSLEPSGRVCLQVQLIEDEKAALMA